MASRVAPKATMKSNESLGGKMENQTETKTNQSQEIVEIAKALSKFQGGIKPALRQASNPYFKSTYADLATLWESIRGPLAENGLAVIQIPETTPETVNLTTTLVHTSGQWIRGTLSLRPVKNDPQGVGSCITYARRYALSAILGLVTEEDDDGNAASGLDPAKNGVNQPKRLSDQPKPNGAPANSAMVARAEEMPLMPTFNPKAAQNAPAVNPGPPLPQLVVDLGKIEIWERKNKNKTFAHYEIKTHRGQLFRTKDKSLLELVKGGRDVKGTARFEYEEKQGYGLLVAVKPN